jgi:hypothetical protein
MRNSICPKENIPKEYNARARGNGCVKTNSSVPEATEEIHCGNDFNVKPKTLHAMSRREIQDAALWRVASSEWRAT